MFISDCKGWIKHLSETELPVLAYTLENICSLTSSDDTPVNKLADAILQDPDLTSNVLKLANSACYNPGNMVISTISRAVMIIGFETVKSIAIASTLVNNLTQGNRSKQLYRCLVRSFHAAIQAKYLAVSHNSTEKEEVFVAALLFDVGEAAFWASNQDQVTQLCNKISLGAKNTSELQQQELGTNFTQLSQGLIRLWHLGPLLEESADNPSSELARIVRTATTIAKIAEKGWDPNKLSAIAQASAKLIGKNPQTIQKELKSNAEKAALLAEKLGIKNARDYLFGGVGSNTCKQSNNFDLQIKSLQMLSSLIVSRAPVHDVLNCLINGIHKGIGMDRVGLFLARPNTKTLYLSSAEGIRSSLWKTGQAIEEPHEYIVGLLRDRNCHLINALSVDTSLRTYEHTSAPFNALIPSLIAPLDSLHPDRGFIYADRLNKCPINNKQFESFKLFILQLQIYIRRDATAA